MVIFHSYVSLPEGTIVGNLHIFPIFVPRLSETSIVWRAPAKASNKSSTLRFSRCSASAEEIYLSLGT